MRGGEAIAVAQETVDQALTDQSWLGRPGDLSGLMAGERLATCDRGRQKPGDDLRAVPFWLDRQASGEMSMGGDSITGPIECPCHS